MKYRITALAVLVAIVVALAPTPAPAQAVNRALTVPVTTVQGLTGTFTILRFANQGGDLVALGTLTLQTVQGVVSTSVAIPVQSITGTCEILNLVLGPLHLDLLGLVV